MNLQQAAKMGGVFGHGSIFSGWSRWVARISLLVLLIGRLSGTAIAEELRCAAVFSDHMVIQEKRPVSVWGWGKPFEKVRVELAGQVLETRIGGSGAWLVTLAPIHAEGPFQLKVSSGRSQVLVNDILVGEVWLAAGQSNMARTMDRVPGCAAEIPAMRDEKLRFFRVNCRADGSPQADVGGQWRFCRPENARFQSATAYYFGKTLRRGLAKPVGIIFSAWGGTPAASWTPFSILASEPALKVWLSEFHQARAKLPERWPEYEKALAKWEALSPPERPIDRPQPPVGDNHRLAPANLYNAMIHPLRTFAVRGVIWYQGESDALSRNASRYGDTFRALIRSWREAWGTDLPFYFVQLPRYLQPQPGSGPEPAPEQLKESGEWMRLRLEQAEVLDLPFTGMVVTVDSEQPTDLHPDNKQAVGTRLGRLVLQDVYASNLNARFPTVSGAPESDGRFVALQVANAGTGLISPAPCTGFSLVGEEEAIMPESIEVGGNRITLRIPEGFRARMIRYVGGGRPAENVFNSEGLPLAPFDLPVP
jgi:sialate O-acetylesterase